MPAVEFNYETLMTGTLIIIGQQARDMPLHLDPYPGTPFRVGRFHDTGLCRGRPGERAILWRKILVRNQGEYCHKRQQPVFNKRRLHTRFLAVERKCPVSVSSFQP